LGARFQIQNLGKAQGRRIGAVSSFVSSQHSRPPNYLPLVRELDDLLLREWLLVLKGDGRSPKTIEKYRESLGQLAGFLARGNFPLLSAVNAEHLREWLGELRERGNKPATVNTRYRAANAFFNWLVSEGERTENPLKRIEPPRVPESVQPYYTAEDVQRVLKALQGRRLKGVDAVRTKTVLLVLFDTGLRAGELCSLRTEDLNWDTQTIVVRETKGSNQRLVSLGTAATRALMAYVRVRGKGSPWLLASLDGQRLTTNALKLSLKRAFAAAAVEFKGIHAFRRASGIEYLRQGGQAEDLRVLMGWRSPEMIRRYVKAAEVERATAAHKKFSPADALGERE
jgi:site-specific recombinase XerD